jgi:hypothetical protein
MGPSGKQHTYFLCTRSIAISSVYTHTKKESCYAPEGNCSSKVFYRIVIGITHGKKMYAFWKCNFLCIIFLHHLYVTTQVSFMMLLDVFQ